MERVDIKIKMTNNIYTNLGRGHCPKYLILCNRTLGVIMLLIKIDHITINVSYISIVKETYYLVIESNGQSMIKTKLVG